MFKTPSKYQFATDSLNSNKPIVYIIQPGDKIEMHIYSNNGFKLVDLTQYEKTMSADPNSGNSTLTYVVDIDSTAKFPVIGRVPVIGMSIREAETKLENLYSRYFNDPYVTVNITNRTALVFLNDQGRGTVVHLVNENTTLFEALALAGGIGELSKSYSIKILRGDPRNPEVFKADLSTVESLKNSQLRILSNDIIYIDAGSRFSKRISTDVVPLVSLVSAVILILNIKNLTK